MVFLVMIQKSRVEARRASARRAHTPFRVSGRSGEQDRAGFA
jgi:hypothetical protein